MEEDNYTRITLRMPRPLHQMLQDAADATSKSMNAEIVARLDKSFSEPADSGAVTALAYRLATLDLQMEARQMELQAIATRAYHLLLLLENAVEGEGDLPTLKQIEEWKMDALKYIKEPRSTKQAIEAKFQAMHELSARVHGALEAGNFEPDIVVNNEDGSLTVYQLEKSKASSPAPATKKAEGFKHFHPAEDEESAHAPTKPVVQRVNRKAPGPKKTVKS